MWEALFHWVEFVLHKKKKSSKAQHHHSVSLLWIKCNQQPHIHATIKFHHYGLYSTTVSRNKHLFLKFLIILYFVIAIRKVTKSKCDKSTQTPYFHPYFSKFMSLHENYTNFNNLLPDINILYYELKVMKSRIFLFYIYLFWGKFLYSCEP